VNRASTTGIDARVAAILCYSLWWATGLLFLILERRDRSVRFHAAQSLVLFGVVSAVLTIVGALSAVALVLSNPLYQIVQAAANGVWVGAAVLWLVLVLRAWRGETWRVPLFATLADGIVAKTSW
jgi:uncharacterized membrane protein